jgi:hypothetical protein
MQLQVEVNATCLNSLLDSRSMDNIVDIQAAARTGIILQGCFSLSVAVTNDDHLISFGCCRYLQFKIVDECFIINCYELALGSYDMVLGSQ